jgi:ankyrin repeat protein
MLIALKKKYIDINQVDEDGSSLLHHTATMNQKDISIYLLDHGADINSLNSLN